MRNFIDNQIAYFFNQFVHRTPVVDALVFQVSHNHLFKGAVLLSIICYAWFKSNIEDLISKKKGFLLIFIVAVFAEFIARAIALLSPFRYRPIYDPELHLQAPYSVNEWILNGWSSFPSDHASLFFAISLSIYFLHKRSGMAALAYTILFIALPRLWLGFHFLTDELVGAAIGCFSAWVGYTYLIHTQAVDKLVAFSERKPEYFYPLLMLFAGQLYEMFESARDFSPIFRWAIKVLLFQS
jgi:undecaprenyl-diphosphatase